MKSICCSLFSLARIASFFVFFVTPHTNPALLCIEVGDLLHVQIHTHRTHIDSHKNWSKIIYCLYIKLLLLQRCDVMPTQWIFSPLSLCVRCLKFMYTNGGYLAGQKRLCIYVYARSNMLWMGLKYNVHVNINVISHLNCVPKCLRYWDWKRYNVNCRQERRHG